MFYCATQPRFQFWDNYRTLRGGIRLINSDFKSTHQLSLEIWVWNPEDPIQMRDACAQMKIWIRIMELFTIHLESKTFACTDCVTLRVTRDMFSSVDLQQWTQASESTVAHLASVICARLLREFHLKYKQIRFFLLQFEYTAKSNVLVDSIFFQWKLKVHRDISSTNVILKI